MDRQAAKPIPLMDDETRTTAFGLWRYAGDYLAAAKVVRASRGRDDIFFPAYFLVGHSIELAMKAFLRASGISVAALRSRTYGHDLERLIRESRKRKLGRLVKLSKNEVLAVCLLSATYKPKELEYIATGSCRLPILDELEGIAGKLVAGLQQFCYKKTFGVPSKRTH